MILSDTHAHLSLVSEELGKERLASLIGDYARAWESTAAEGRSGSLLLDPGVDPDDLGPRLELLAPEGRLPPFIRLAAGLWPSARNLASPRSSLDALEVSIARASRDGLEPAAIGECGLDYHHMEGSAEAQALLFEGQIALATRLGLPLIVHSREAAAETLVLISRGRSSAPVIIHCFGYGPSEARAFLDSGCWLSFAGNLTYKGSDALREACAAVPDDRFLLETDSPYMNPVPLRGKASTPLDIERTYALAAGLRSVGVGELAETVSRNARSLFG
jgi:TatD DNase family protein